MNLKIITLCTAFALSGLTHGQPSGGPGVLDKTPRQAEPVEIIDVKPGIELSAPLTCEVGELVEFSAFASNVDSLVWEIIPKTPDFRVMAKSRVAFFSARPSSSGESFRLVLAGAKGGEAFLFHQVITVKGPTVAPSKMQAAVNLWATLVPKAENRSAKLRAMAGVFRQLAESEIEVDKILDATAIANSAVLNGDLEVWIPFLDAMGTEIDRLGDAGELDTPSQYRKTWREIADALDILAS